MAARSLSELTCKRANIRIHVWSSVLIQKHLELTLVTGNDQAPFLIFFVCVVFCFVLFLLYNTVLVLPYIDMNPPRVYMSSQSWTPLPPPTPYHLSGSSRAPAPSILYPVSNIDWRFVSYMIVYMFQCHSPKSSPLPLPQSPKVHSIYLCLFCCLAYRVIITIFLNSIYMC